MSDLTLSQAIDNIYASIKNNNEDLDPHIAALKAAMAREGAKEAVFEPAKLAQSNRQGRKIMQSYFKKKGVGGQLLGLKPGHSPFRHIAATPIEARPIAAYLCLYPPLRRRSLLSTVASIRISARSPDLRCPSSGRDRVPTSANLPARSATRHGQRGITCGIRTIST